MRIYKVTVPTMYHSQVIMCHLVQTCLLFALSLECCVSIYNWIVIVYWKLKIQISERNNLLASELSVCSDSRGCRKGLHKNRCIYMTFSVFGITLHVNTCLMFRTKGLMSVQCMYNLLTFETQFIDSWMGDAKFESGTCLWTGTKIISAV